VATVIGAEETRNGKYLYTYYYKWWLILLKKNKGVIRKK
jgi:hypothetical protein